jgi:nicotinate-nucleotide--dimethylbenzimidazole phosphoribosyltransferase
VLVSTRSLALAAQPAGSDGDRVGYLARVTIQTPNEDVRLAAAERLGALATPPGALGRLGELGVWVAACQGVVPPRPVDNVRLVIFAGDHGVAQHGVSAFPPAITGAMVRTFLGGRAGVSALAKAHGVQVRVLDLGVDEDFEDLDEDFEDLDEATREALTQHKIRRGSGAIHLEDALSAEETRAALEAGAAVAREEIAAGAQLLISGDMGIGNTTPAAAMVAAGLGLPASEVTGRGTGIGDDALRTKTDVITAALDRAGERAGDPVETLAALGSADLAATTGYLLEAARSGTPVLLDGLMSVACALTADRIEPGAATWYAAGHRSTEPAQSMALEKLGLEPLLDLDLRLGEGSGAVAAVPVVRSAVALLRDVALLSELAPGDPA